MELGEGMRIVAPEHVPRAPTAGSPCARRRSGSAPRRTAPSGSRVSGTVVEQVYLGSLSQTVVEIATGERLIVHELNDDERADARARRRASC